MDVALSPVDVVASAVLAVAALRGLFRGLIREAFSFAALAAAVLAVRLFREPGARWLMDSGATEGVAPWLAGAGLAVAAIAAVTVAGRVLRLGARVAGLGWADRAGGAALGLAEGAIATGAVVLVAVTLLGRTHPLFADSLSLAALERLERATGEVVDVAAPPPQRGEPLDR